MKSWLLLLLRFIASAASSQEGAQIGRQKSCVGCQRVDKCNSVLSFFQQIAAKCKVGPDVLRYVGDKMASGTKAVWSRSARVMSAYLTVP